MNLGAWLGWLAAHRLELAALATFAAWATALAMLLVWMAATRWKTAGFLAAIMLAVAWALVESFAFGPVGWAWHATSPGLWRADARHDAGLLLTWADPVKPWQMIAVLVALFTWCKLRHQLHQRKHARPGPAWGR
jgi:hypothetical protein